MIHSCRFRLSSPMPATAAYPLYAALLERAPKEFAVRLHESSVTPVSQYVCGNTWQISFFGREAIEALTPVAETMDDVFLRRDHTHLELQLDSTRSIHTVEELLDSGTPDHGALTFRTPTAFKSAGVYQLLPTQRLLMQSLILKWNGCFADVCPIEDDGGGLDALAEGLRYHAVQLYSEPYIMKHTQIPGVLGTISYDNRLSGFHRQLANALLTFGTYSGVGIKTALGMGGLQITEK